jgi:hypothetical protein
MRDLFGCPYAGCGCRREGNPPIDDRLVVGIEGQHATELQVLRARTGAQQRLQPRPRCRRAQQESIDMGHQSPVEGQPLVDITACKRQPVRAQVQQEPQLVDVFIDDAAVETVDRCPGHTQLTAIEATWMSIASKRCA